MPRAEDFALSLIQIDMGTSLCKESPHPPAQENSWRRGVTWRPCVEKHAKARSHLMPLCGKVHEGEESPIASVRILSALQILLDYYASCLRPYKVVFN